MCYYHGGEDLPPFCILICSWLVSNWGGSKATLKKQVVVEEVKDIGNSITRLLVYITHTYNWPHLL